MMALIILLLPVAEILLAITAIKSFGFANTFFAWLMGTVLGIGLLRSSSFRMTTGVAQAVRSGQVPARAAIESALIGLAGLLFLLPGFFSDGLALALLIPGIRPLIASKILTKTVTFAAARGSPAQPSPQGAPHVEAAADIIDVEAVRVSTTRKSDANET